ncbi:MAG: homocitrate synthase [Chloroflexota bacterium]
MEQFNIIESTLREGEQFVGANFTTEQKVQIAQALDKFGVEYLELTSPVASPQSYTDCMTIAGLGLQARILTHIRCNLEDAKAAATTGVDGIDVVVGTSSLLRTFSHGKDIPWIIETGREVISFIQDKGLEARFSTEDSFRSEREDIFRIYEAMDGLGIDRVGIADTVGVATPLDVYRLIKELRGRIAADIEFHGHNDSGCAIANAYSALEAGATHVDTSVLGIGERNGITSLGGFIARMYATNRNLLVRKYDLPHLQIIDRLVADTVGVDIPFSNYITGITAFTHKAGVHAKAVLNNPETYEILKPQDFGLTRYISIAHRLTGWNAVAARAEQLDLHLDNQDLKRVTAHLKAIADHRHLTIDDVDSILRNWIPCSEGKEEPVGERMAS